MGGLINPKGVKADHLWCITSWAYNNAPRIIIFIVTLLWGRVGEGGREGGREGTDKLY